MLTGFGLTKLFSLISSRLLYISWTYTKNINFIRKDFLRIFEVIH